MARSDYEELTRGELLTVIERAEARMAQQALRIAQQDARIKQLEHLLDRATRSGKRQAAPFSKQDVYVLPTPCFAAAPTRGSAWPASSPPAANMAKAACGATTPRQ